MKDWQEVVARLWPDDHNVPFDIQQQAWAEVLDLEYLSDLRDRQAWGRFVERVPIGFARQHGFLAFEGEPPMVVVRDITSRQQIDTVRRTLRCHCRYAIVTEDALMAAINVAYQARDDQAHVLVGNMESDRDDSIAINAAQDLLDISIHPPVIKLVNTVLLEAIKARASDIHIQPLESEVVVRQRIDGVLFDTLRIPQGFRDEVLTRFKVLGKMNIAEKRLPQDGRASVQVGDSTVDLRIASLPTSFGERIVVRFLDKGARLYSLEELGMDAAMLGRFSELIKLEHGLLLVTGPTGSGKSTTLYAALQEINSGSLNVLTLEDPIEYQLEGISQTQINPKKGLTFASGLRNVLRQDPDIIMVGEIRDHETAEMAIQSALTGHFVFSTLHTNDAASAVTRLLDLGIEPYLVASSLVAVVAQRLVRKICDRCKQEYGGKADLTRLGIDADWTLWKGNGCDACRGMGYRGRVGVFELLTISERVGSLIQRKANAAELRAVALEGGMQLLRDDGIQKVRRSLTTVDEIVRVASRGSQ